MAGRKTKVRAVRLRSLYCTAIIALLMVIGARAMERQHFPIMKDAEMGLPPLGERLNPTVSELRIWILRDNEDDRTSYVLRLSTSWGGPVEGELVQLSQDQPGLHARRLPVSRSWPAVLHDLDRHSVWDLYEPVPTVLCMSRSTMVVESYRYGQYHRVDVFTTANYTDRETARNVEEIFDYVYGLATESAQIASLARPASISC